MLRLSAFLLVFLITVFMAAGETSFNPATDAVYSGSPPLQLTDDVPYEKFNRPWPDGSKILFTCERDATRYDIFTVPTDGSMVKTKISPGDESYDHADVNPAGTHICYCVGADTDAKWEIAVLEMGGAETIITDNVPSGWDSNCPTYNGEGTKIAYVKADWTNHVGKVVVVDTDGSNEVEICTVNGSSNMIYSMDWLGNDNALIYTTFGGGLYRVTATAGAVPVVVDATETYHVCSSNSDGSKIAASCADGTHQKYVSINPDGTGKTTIVDLDSFPIFQNFWCMLCWTADDAGIIVLATEDGVNQDIYLVTSFTNVESSSLGSLKTRFR
jgi:hypothetical protein